MGDASDLAGSEYLLQVHGLVAGRPSVDLAAEARLQEMLVTAAERGLLQSAHDCSHGGLAVTLAESCIAGGVGLLAPVPVAGRLDAALFGEAQSRAAISVKPENAPAISGLARDLGVPCLRLGETGGDEFRFAAWRLPVRHLAQECEAGLMRAFKETDEAIE